MLCYNLKMLLIIIIFLAFNSFCLDFFPLEDLKEGMKGEVKTCLKGTEPQSYPIEIKGILRGSTEKDFIILGKILSPEFEKTGIIAGMSGSPVLIQGKLLGALAYAWGFSKEPLCGITYWKNVLELKGEGKKGLNYLKEEELLLPYENLSIKLLKEFERLIGNLKSLNLQSYPSRENTFSIMEGGIVEKNKDYPLESGYPIAVMLAWGDFNLFASGTITFKDKDTIYAFGHPFLDLGKVEMAFARAYPELVIPSLSRSFRLSNGGEIIGTLEVDGKDGVLGKIGKIPEGIKIKVKIGNSEKNFKVLDHPLLVPVLSGMGVSSLFYEEKKNSGSGVVSMEVKIGKEIKKEFFFESQDLFSSISSKIVALMGIFYLNPFEEFKAEEIEINFKEIKEKNKFYISKVIVEKRKIKNEREIETQIFLKDFFGKLEKLKEKIKLDGKGNFEIYFSGAKELEKIFKKEQISLNNLKELKETLMERPQEGFLYIYLKSPEDSYLSNPYLFKKITLSLLSKFPENKKRNYGIYKIKEIKLPYPVEGWEEIKIEVEK